MIEILAIILTDNLTDNFNLTYKIILTDNFNLTDQWSSG